MNKYIIISIKLNYIRTWGVINSFWVELLVGIGGGSDLVQWMVCAFWGWYFMFFY